jgi:hypothetical protein
MRIMLREAAAAGNERGLAVLLLAPHVLFPCVRDGRAMEHRHDVVGAAVLALWWRIELIVVWFRLLFLGHGLQLCLEAYLNIHLDDSIPSRIAS